jgi:hypothetical protein
MQPNDYLAASFHMFYKVLLMEQYTVLVRSQLAPDDVVAYSPMSVLDLTNEANFEMAIQVCLVSQNTSNTIPVTTALNHYERPQWVYFGAGVVLSSLAVIPIFKSKKQA